MLVPRTQLTASKTEIYKMLNRLKRYKRFMNTEYAFGIAKSMFLSPKNNAGFRVAGSRMKIRPPSFIAQYREIFIEGEYAFDCETDAPRILDLGANVGMSCLYFLTQFPNASIDAFEADPEIYAVLEENVKRFGHGNVTARNLAVWTKEGALQFHPNGLGGGALSAVSCPGYVITVQAIDLKAWLAGKTYDLIKMDIEGAETAIFPHCISEMSRCPRLIFEYHSRRDKPQELADLLSLLRDYGYRVHLKTCNPSFEPLKNLATKSGAGFDNQINIFASRKVDVE